MDRIMRRAHALAFHLAVSHLKLVETRLLVILWYYADRWGRVTPGGVLLPLRMTHSLLARVVGARRPSVSTALGRLRTAAWWSAPKTATGCCSVRRRGSSRSSP